MTTGVTGVVLAVCIWTIIGDHDAIYMESWVAVYVHACTRLSLQMCVISYDD